MAYGIFAEFYDGLTQDVDYAEKAEYLLELFRRFSHEPGVTLDLACGTGSLAVELKQRGVDVFGADMSSEMLTQAQLKSSEIMFVRQKMQSLTLPMQIDSCVCTLDSISHLPGAGEVSKAFSRVSEYLAEGGMFVFDVNTPYKHEKILGNNTFVYDTEDVYLVWQNTFHESDCSVKIELDFFAPSGNKYERYSENFREFAYPADEITKMLEENGFELLAVYDGATFSPPKETSDRLTFAARKI